MKCRPRRSLLLGPARVPMPSFFIPHPSSLPMSGRQESNLPVAAYQTAASPPGPRPDSSAPCTGLEPVSPARQAGRHTRCVTGRKSVRRESHPPIRRGRSVPGLLGHGHKSKDGRIRTLWQRLWRPPALPGARPCSPAAPAGLEPATIPLTAGRSTV